MNVADRLVTAVARWATATRIALYCGALLGAAIIVAMASIALGDPPFDAFGRPIAEDFVAKSIGGRIAADGHFGDLYDTNVQRRVQLEILGERESYRDRLNPFLSPPFVAVLYAPLTALPYLGAVALWTIGSVLAIVASLAALRAIVPLVRRAGLARILLVAFALQPTVELLGNGQDGAVSLAILVSGLRLLAAGRDAAAGAALGLGAFKPQIFFLLPLLLVLERRWRALLAAAAVLALLSVFSLALVGGEGANDYVALLASDLYRRGIGEELRWKMLSLPAFTGALLPPGWRASGAGLLQVSFVVAAAALLVRSVGAAPRIGPRAPIALSYSVAVLLTACVNPHFFVHDGLVLLLPALVLLDRSPDDERLRALLLVGFVLLWTGPLRQAAFGSSAWPLSIAAAPWPALVIAALAAYAVRSMRAATRPSP